MAKTTFAILGATGKTGRGVVEQLLAKTDVNLHIYVRSVEKLVSIFPDISLNPRVGIFQGSVRDAALMTKCLSEASTVFFTLGENDNRPGLTVIQDGTRSVLSALQTLKEGSGFPNGEKPRIIMLSSSTWNPRFAAARPALLHWVIKTAFGQAYADLRKGTALFQDSPSLCHLLLVQPGALVQDEPTGYEISTESVRMSATYGDLAGAMVELATVPSYGELNAVGVSSKDGDNTKHLPIMMFWMFKGLCAHYIPGFWPMHDATASWTGWLLGRK